MLLIRALAAATMAAVSVQAVPQAAPMTPDKLMRALPVVEPEQPDVVFRDYPLVKRIDCAEGKGTGFRVGANHMLSVAHVTGLTECAIHGLPISLTEQDTAHDFSRFDTGLAEPNGFAVDCKGFVPGHWYWSVGHAQGAGFQTAIAVYATIYRDQAGKRILLGHHTFIPGMSGGPVIDPATGKVVGTVNAYVPGEGASISRELKDTSACKAAA